MESDRGQGIERQDGGEDVERDRRSGEIAPRPQDQRRSGCRSARASRRGPCLRSGGSQRGGSPRDRTTGSLLRRARRAGAARRLSPRIRLAIANAMAVSAMESARGGTASGSSVSPRFSESRKRTGNAASRNGWIGVELFTRHALLNLSGAERRIPAEYRQRTVIRVTMGDRTEDDIDDRSAIPDSTSRR